MANDTLLPKAEPTDEDLDAIEAESSVPEPLINPMEGEIGHKVCIICKEENLKQSIHLMECPRCVELYCLHFSSSVDPSFCSDCNHKVELVDQTYTRIDSFKIPATASEEAKDYKRISKSRQLIFSGLDWLFFQRKIYTLSDIELALAVEYHHTIYQSMLAERERRKIEYFHRNAGKPTPLRISTGDTISGNSKSITVKSSSSIKAVKQNKAEVQLKAVIEQLLKAGLSAEQIQTMLAKGKK